MAAGQAGGEEDTGAVSQGWEGWQCRCKETCDYRTARSALCPGSSTSVDRCWSWVCGPIPVCLLRTSCVTSGNHPPAVLQSPPHRQALEHRHFLGQEPLTKSYQLTQADSGQREGKAVGLN